MKKKFRIREGSVADYGRYGLTGLIFGLLMGIMTIWSYGMN